MLTVIVVLNAPKLVQICYLYFWNNLTADRRYSKRVNSSTWKTNVKRNLQRSGFAKNSVVVTTGGKWVKREGWRSRKSLLKGVATEVNSPLNLELIRLGFFILWMLGYSMAFPAPIFEELTNVQQRYVLIYYYYYYYYYYYLLQLSFHPVSVVTVVTNKNKYI
jgi:hypothetical protein